MSTYFISDVHGRYEVFIKLLEAIKFSKNDKLIILGDIIDKGDKSIKMIKFVRNQPNIQMILGNHEYEFLNKYHNLMKNLKDGDDINLILTKLQDHFPNKKEKLEWDDIDYLDNLPYYIETDKYICVHAGLEIDLNGNILPFDKTDINYFLFDRTLKSESCFPKTNKTILFGHTPCCYDKSSGRFIKTLRQANLETDNFENYLKIRLDTGVHYNLLLGALRLEDMCEFYMYDGTYVLFCEDNKKYVCPSDGVLRVHVGDTVTWHNLTTNNVLKMKITREQKNEISFEEINENAELAQKSLYHKIGDIVNVCYFQYKIINIEN